MHWKSSRTGGTHRGCVTSAPTAPRTSQSEGWNPRDVLESQGCAGIPRPLGAAWRPSLENFPEEPLWRSPLKIIPGEPPWRDSLEIISGELPWRSSLGNLSGDFLWRTSQEIPTGEIPGDSPLSLSGHSRGDTSQHPQ